MTLDETDMELVHGSGNLYRDLARPDPETRQLKAILASEISKVLKRDELTTRRAQEITGFNHADFARVRGYRIEKFTVDRLIAMLEGLGQEVEVSVTVHPRRTIPTQQLHSGLI